MNKKSDFPIFDILENGEHLIYLDNAATTQKPQVVIDSLSDYYRQSNANPHRGVYTLAARATDIYEAARDRVARFINAGRSEVIFTKNTTEALNLIAYSYAGSRLKPNDEILIGISEHHANIIPWQEAAKRTGAVLKYLYLNEDQTYSEDEIDRNISSRTKIVSMASISNVLGIKNPIEYLIKKAHSVGAVAVIDAAQSIAHMPTDVKSLDADFLVFSGHKAYAPMGIGVLYGKAELLNAMPPFLTGGSMILSVSEQSTSYAKAPNRFEAGTQDVAVAAGLHTALDYIEGIGFDEIMRHEKELMSYALSKLSRLPYLTMYGGGKEDDKNGIISFNIEGVHPHDAASIMDASGVTIRAGHHCAQPLMEYLRIPSCCRASFGIYNSLSDIDELVGSIENTRRILGLGA